MITYPNINPEIFHIGPISVHWYGVMYALGFGSSYLLVKYQVQKKMHGADGMDKREDAAIFSPAFLDSLYTYLILGLIIGARLGYILFYDLAAYIRNPLEIFAVWHGGMSFHGGMIGCLTAGFLCCRFNQVAFWQTSDMVIVTAPVGLGFGRIGNFINGELFGRVTDVPWSMVFPEGGPLPRHPSQLYEFMLEGVVLFIILWFVKDRRLLPGVLNGLFLVFYGLFRFFVEFFREPDPQLGFIVGPFTMGQILSVLTALAGIFLIIFLQRKRAL
jgi:phosphatidylglycerol:prolipoprotein diacylglycerol transferase